MLSTKVLDVAPLDDMRLLVFFEDGVTKIFDVKPIMDEYPEFEDLKNPDLLNLVQVEAGGYGISWNSELDCSEGELYENGTPIPLSLDDFKTTIKHTVTSCTEATQQLNCSRQNIDYLISHGKLQPIKVYPRDKLFFRPDLVARNRNKRSYTFKD